MELGLDDKVAFVAGSSRGIGLSIAQAFLREGARVVITGRDGDRLAGAWQQLARAFSPERVLSIRGDMTDRQDIERALNETIDVHHGVDAVVANVGSGTARTGWQLSEQDWQESLNINLLGGMALASAATPHLIARGGSLTFISSITGAEALSAPVPYSASKAAVLSAMKNLSRILGSDGVRVNAVAPGNILFPGGTWERRLAERRGFFEEYIRSEVPLQRFGRPEEIADAVVFLASDRARFITGACLTVDGGQTRSL